MRTVKVWAVAVDGTEVNHHLGPQQADGSILSTSATGNVASHSRALAWSLMEGYQERGSSVLFYVFLNFLSFCYCTDVT